MHEINSRKVHSSKKKITVALLISDLKNEYDVKIWAGVKKAALNKNINIICLEGGVLGLGFHLKRNEIFNLINQENLSGIISVSSPIGNIKGKPGIENLLKPFTHIPIVSIGMKLRGINSIMIDNVSGMQHLLDHLYKVHNYSRIVFIRGPKENTEAELRYKTYLDFLKKNNIPFDENLIIQGDFLIESELTDFRKLLKNKKIKYDAVAACNDVLAVKAVIELKKFGISVPDEVAVTGFDDSDFANEITLPLTTVRQPIFDLGYKSLDIIMSKINKQLNNQDFFDLPTKLIVRRSCGCNSKYIITGNKTSHINIEKIKELENNSEKIIISVLENIDPKIENFYTSDINKDDIDNLLSVFINTLKDLKSNKFFMFVEKIITNSDLELKNIILWGDLISIFFENLSKFFHDKSCNEIFYEIWRKSNEYFRDFYKKVIQNANFKDKMEHFELNLTSDNLTSVLKKEAIKKQILSRFPKLGVKACYIFLYNDKKKEQSELFYGYNINNNQLIKYQNKIFKTLNVIPDSFINNGSYSSWIVTSLFFKNMNIGFAVFGVDNENVLLINTLTYQLSSALRSTELMDKIRKHSETLELKVHERTKKLENAKKEIEEANKELKKLDKLKNDFIANITHDFRSPLTAILNIAHLGNKLAVNDELKDNFKTIYDASLKLNNSIEHLLNLAKMDAQGIKLNISKIDIISFFERIINFYSSSVRNTGIKFKKILPDKKQIYIYTDPEKLEQVIDNIISNAVKFINPETGVITFYLENKIKSILICIRDNGIGIPFDKLNSVFKRFEQVHNEKNKYGGTGIGLAFSKQLIDFLKGKIWAESMGEGTGAGFFIELRKDKSIFDKKDFSENLLQDNKTIKKLEIESLIQSNIKKYYEKDEVAEYIEELNNENEYDYKKSLILIVDDDKNIRKIIIKYLKINGYKNFILAPSGKMGLDAVYDYNPDIIISDYNMPELSGDEFHNTVISNPKYKKIPFIFLSAVSDSVIIHERKRVGASAYLMKPINEKDFIVTIDHHLKKYFEYLKMVQLASIDFLTGIKNRRFIIESLDHEISIRRYRDISILFFDVDNFKFFNDTYGHLLGDKILSELGRIINSTIRNYDIAGRYGGDEFLIILPETNINQAEVLAETIRTKISNNKIIFKEKQLSVSVSIGITSLKNREKYFIKKLHIDNLKHIFESKKPEATDWKKNEKYKLKIRELLLNAADEALYESKKSICCDCGFNTTKMNIFLENKCPECGSENIIIGRNKISKK